MPDPYQRGSAQKPRRWTREGFVPFQLEVLTPIFISSGEDLSPLEYVIREENGEYALHLVDTKIWLLAGQEKTDVRAALDRGDILSLRRLMDDQLDANIYSLERIPFAAPATAKELLKHIKNAQSMSKAEIQPFIRSPSTMAAFVPGSSLKGALSTPLIDKFDQGLKAASAASRDGYRRTMERMFGPINEHAMQALKVADIPIPSSSTHIVSATEARLKQEPGTPKTPCEVLSPEKERKLPIYGRLFMDTSREGPSIALPGGKNLSLLELASICNAFYAQRFRTELATFYQLAHLSQVGKNLLPVKKRIDELDPEREILLRVGHYSHIECMTVRESAPRFKKGFGKTRTLANQNLPFGWVILRFCDEEEYRQGLKKVEDQITSAVQARETRRIKQEKELEIAITEQKKLAAAVAEAKAKAEEERKKQEQEAAEREAKLASLSPEERAIAEVEDKNSTEAQSMALFAQLKSLSPELQKKAAQALQECWKRLGKWDGKLSKKQKEKVTTVKSFLG